MSRSSREAARDLLYAVLKPEQVKDFETNWRLCISTYFPDIGHFRIALYYAGACVEGAIRVCPPVIRGLEDLGLPNVVSELARRHAGLVLITGPTGVGKTTTMAAMVDQINRERQAKIVMVEDPIEYRHMHRKSIVVQQEIGSDTKSFKDALIHILRMDPDVVCVGEMRDLETISTALTAAETGHLVLATLHTPDCPGTIDRIAGRLPLRTAAAGHHSVSRDTPGRGRATTHTAPRQARTRSRDGGVDRNAGHPQSHPRSQDLSAL